MRSGAKLTYRTVPREARQQNLRTETGKGIALRYRIEYRAGSRNLRNVAVGVIPMGDIITHHPVLDLSVYHSDYVATGATSRDCSPALWYVEFSTALRAPVSSFLVRSSRRRDCSLKPWYVAIFRDVLLPSWYVGT